MKRFLNDIPFEKLELNQVIRSWLTGSYGYIFKIQEDGRIELKMEFGYSLIASHEEFDLIEYFGTDEFLENLVKERIALNFDPVTYPTNVE